MVEIPKKEPDFQIEQKESYTKEECIAIGKALLDWLKIQDKFHVFIRNFLIEHNLYSSFIKTHSDRYAEFAKLIEDARFVEQSNIVKQASLDNLNAKFCVEYLRQKHGWITKGTKDPTDALKKKTDPELDEQIEKLQKHMNREKAKK